MQTKAVEAFRYGRPLVATSHGMQGITANGDFAIIADEPEAFAEACLRFIDAANIARCNELAVAEYEKMRSGAMRALGEAVGRI